MCTIKITCIECGNKFEMTEHEVEFYKKKDCYLLTVFKKRFIDLSNNLDIGIPVSSEYCLSCSQSFVSTAFEIAVLVVNPLFFFIKSPQINNNIYLHLMSS